MTHRIKLILAGASALLALAAADLSHAETTLSFLIDNNPDTVAAAEALVAAYQTKAPDVTIEIEPRAGGGEGDNIIKTRLATGEMSDVFLYNSGSLLQALKPTQTLVDLSGLASQAKADEGFKSVVRADGKLYGVPFGTAMAGASSTTGKSTRTSACQSRRHGRTSWRTTQRSRHQARSPWRRPIAIPGPRSYSFWRTITTCMPPCRTSPPTTLPTRRNTPTRRRP